jgi:hypothetical protein
MYRVHNVYTSHISFFYIFSLLVVQTGHSQNNEKAKQAKATERDWVSETGLV